jgi:hypothetical protein
MTFSPQSRAEWGAHNGGEIEEIGTQGVQEAYIPYQYSNSMSSCKMSTHNIDYAITAFNLKMGRGNMQPGEKEEGGIDGGVWRSSVKGDFVGLVHAQS